ncbi:glycosyl hydrolase family 8 [Bacillus tianshenii]|nr:glycosyl hydrolase family 8 [Bacillus tianshenii]
MNRMKLAVISIIVLFILGILTKLIYDSFKMDDVQLKKPLEQFIWSEMTFDNGMLKTTFKSTSGEHYSLAESLGLWMEYAVMSDNEPLFQHAYNLLNKYYAGDVGLVHWRVLANGKPTEDVNAFLDDIRIVQALLDASEKWEESKYEKRAKNISKALEKYSTYEDTFVDFYDWKHETKSHQFTTTYFDLWTMRRLNERGWVDEKTIQEMERLAYELSQIDSPLLPTAYDIDSQQFIYKDTVNMSEQVYGAYHLARAGVRTESFYTFIKQEFNTHQKLFGQYEANGAPAAKVESPALYGLTILYALEVQDEELALSLYERMKAFQVQEGTYAGVYMDTKAVDTHIFDNLVPLMAERSLQERGLIR